LIPVNFPKAQLIGVHVPSGLRQAAPRAVWGLPSIYIVWVYWRQVLPAC
jgi:hypothetical protein